MRTLHLFLLFFFVSLAIQAQDLTFYGILPAINQTGKINSKMNYNLFVSSTFDCFKREIDGQNYPATDLQFYFQPSLNFNPGKRINFTLSYTYQRNNPLRTVFVNEHRLWQQVTLTESYKKFKLSNRFRFEERFIENKATGDYPLSTRLRYQLDFSIPLQVKNNKGFYFHASNEFYFSLTGQKNALYSENWAYLALGWIIRKNHKLEFGYLNQILVRDPLKDFRILNLLQISWVTNFQFHRFKEN